MQAPTQRRKSRRTITIAVIIIVLVVIFAFVYHAFNSFPQATATDVQRTYTVLTLGSFVVKGDGSSTINMTFLKCGVTVDGLAIQVASGIPFTWTNLAPDTFAVGDRLTLTFSAGQTITLSSSGTYLWLRTHVANPSCGNALGTVVGQEFDLPIPSSDIIALES